MGEHLSLNDSLTYGVENLARRAKMDIAIKPKNNRNSQKTHKMSNFKFQKLINKYINELQSVYRLSNHAAKKYKTLREAVNRHYTWISVANRNLPLYGKYQKVQGSTRHEFTTLTELLCSNPTKHT